MKRLVIASVNLHCKHPQTGARAIVSKAFSSAYSTMDAFQFENFQVADRERVRCFYEHTLFKKSNFLIS